MKCRHLILILLLGLWLLPEFGVVSKAFAGGPKPGCIGLLCGRKFIPDRQFIPDRDLIWDWSRWSRSWQESVGEFGELSSDSPVVRALQWGVDLPGVESVLQGLGYVNEQLRGMYGEYFRTVTGGVTGTEGIGSLTPYEEFWRGVGESGFTAGEMTAGGIAVGGVAGSAVAATRAIGTMMGEMAGGMPGIVTSTGAVIPAAAALPGYGGAGTGAGAAIGFGGGFVGIQQAEMSAAVRVTSSIKGNPRLVKIASNLNSREQAGIDSLIKQLMAGNPNPGMGVKLVGGTAGILEVRHVSGGRVFFRRTVGGGIDIVAKGGHANEHIYQQIFNILRKTY